MKIIILSESDAELVCGALIKAETALFDEYDHLVAEGKVTGALQVISKAKRLEELGRYIREQ